MTVAKMIREHLHIESELWESIDGYEGLYFVSNQARVRKIQTIVTDHLGRKWNSPEKILKQTTNIGGYKTVMLGRKGFQQANMVHRLVAKAFIPNHKEKPFINHINGIKSDNRPENLEWCTRHENMQHAVRTGLFPNRIGSNQPASIFVESDIIDIRRLHQKGMNFSQIGRKYNCHYTTILCIIRGKTWTHVK